MEQSFRTDIINKEEKYQHFLPDWELLISGETDEIAVLANTCAALREAFGFFWIGFYLVKDGQLVLGPFQGDVACYRIRKGRGVCGTAWAEAKTSGARCGTIPGTHCMQFALEIGNRRACIQGR